MSGKNNVNPDHYKTAGRDRQGENVVHKRQKQSLAQDQARLDKRKGELIPNQATAAEKPTAQKPTAGKATGQKATDS